MHQSIETMTLLVNILIPYQVIWNAPLSVRGVCVRLSARVGPTLTANKWSVLARKICPTSAGPSSLNRQPPIVEPCCACDEAKYEVMFL